MSKKHPHKHTEEENDEPAEANTPARRPPWTADYVCTVHDRPGDDPDELTCGPGNFRLKTDVHAEKQTKKLAEKWPSPRTGHLFLKVTPVWAIGTPTGHMMIENTDGEQYPVDLDVFHRRYRPVRSDLAPDTVLVEIERVLRGVGLIGDAPPAAPPELPPDAEPENDAP